MADLASAASLTVSTATAEPEAPTVPLVAPPAPTSPVWPTESVRLRAALVGPAGVLRLLGSARPADVADALAALTPDQLAEAVAEVELPLAPAVVAHLSRRGPAQARQLLARRLVQQPELVPARALTLDAYRRTLAEAAATDYRDGAVVRIRALALEALCAGALTAEQVVEHTRPAALTLALAVCTPADHPRPWARRATGDVRVLLARVLAEDLGEDYDRWAAAIALSGTFGGTVAELLRSDESPTGVHRFADGTSSSHAPQNVLLALAPRGIAARYLVSLGEPPHLFSQGRFVRRWEWLISSGPLSRPLVEHVVAHGNGDQWRWLVRNELCPDSALRQAPPGHTRVILRRKVLPPRVRGQMFRTFAPEPSEAGPWARGMVRDRPDQLLDLAWSLTDAPNLLRHVVAADLADADPATLVCLYGALAHAAGPEIVWALDLDRAGTLDDVLPQVRASMAACSAEPLVEAARQTPRRHWIDVLDPDLAGCQSLRADAELDRTGHLPLEALVAARLDGRPDRWRAVVRRLAAGDGPAEAVIAAPWTLHDPAPPAD